MLEVKWYHQCYHWILYKSDNFYWRFFILLLCCSSTTLSNVNLEIEWNIQDHKFNSQSASTFYLSLHFEYRYMLTIDKTIKKAFLCLTAAVFPHSYFCLPRNFKTPSFNHPYLPQLCECPSNIYNEHLQQHGERMSTQNA